MLQLPSGRKWRIVWKLQHFIAIHYWGYVIGVSLEVKGWWWLLLPSCLLINTVQQPGISSPLSQLTSEGIICMHRASFSSSSSYPLTLSSTDVSSQLMGWWFSHACSAIADFSVQFVWSPQRPHWWELLQDWVLWFCSMVPNRHSAGAEP